MFEVAINIVEIGGDFPVIKLGGLTNTSFRSCKILKLSDDVVNDFDNFKVVSHCTVRIPRCGVEVRFIPVKCAGGHDAFELINCSMGCD